MPVMPGKLHHTIFFWGKKLNLMSFGFIYCRVVVKTSSFESKSRPRPEEGCVRVKNESKWVHDKTKINENMVSDSVLSTTRQ